MKRERRQPTPAEWARITSSRRPAVRRVLLRGAGGDLDTPIEETTSWRNPFFGRVPYKGGEYVTGTLSGNQPRRVDG